MGAGRTLTVNVVRTDVAKSRLAQAVVPVAVIVTILARRTMEPWLLATAAAVLVTAALLLRMARRNVGRRELQAWGDRLQLGGGPPLEIARKQVRSWTLDAGVARLYTAEAAWRVDLPSTYAEELRRLLASALGSPLSLRRRGSPRARKIAGVVAASGIGLVVVAIALEIVPLVVVGVPAMIIGLATLGALSQKIVS